MKIDKPRLMLVTLLVGALWLLAPAQPAAAQERWDDPVIIKRKPTAPRVRAVAPAPRPNVRRTARRPVVRTAPTTERAALLTLQWRIIKFSEDGTQEEVNPGGNFAIQDKLRLAVKVNQDGYLYIVRQKEKGADGQIVFPDKRYNDGSNAVKKNQEFILPSNCQNFDVPCWYAVQAPAGQELFTLVFSRDPKEALPSEAAEGDIATIKPELLNELVSTSGQQLRRSQGVINSRFTIWIRNTNQEDNEEIIETVVLNKGDVAATTTTAATATPTETSPATTSAAPPRP